MVDPAGIHALTVELHAGFLTLAAIALVLVSLGQIFLRFSHSGEGSFYRLVRKAVAYLEPTSLVAATAGVLALILSGLTGMEAWGGSDAVLDNPITRNKIVLTIIVTVMWALVVLMRLRLGRGLWRRTAPAAFYVIFAEIAFGLTTFIASMGAHLSQGGSIIDPLLEVLGIDYTNDLSLDPGMSLLIMMISVIVIVLCLFMLRRRGIKLRELMREGEKGSRWPEIGR